VSPISRAGVAAGVILLLWCGAALVVVFGPSILARVLATPGVVEGTADSAFYLSKLRATVWAAARLGSLYVVAILVLLVATGATSRSVPSPPRAALLAGTLLLYVTSSSVPRYLTGDEPHYLAMAESIATDLDLELSDEYAARPELEAHRHQADVDRGLYSIHNPGLGLLLALPWLVAGPRGAVLAIALIGALVAVALDAWLADHGCPAGDRVAAVVAFSLCLPALSFAGQLFPDAPAALLFTIAIRELTRPMGPGTRVWPVALAFAALPWLHARYLPGVALLLAWAWWMALRRRSRRLATTATGALVATLLAMAGVNLRWFASPWPNAMRGSLEQDLGGRPLEGLLGLLFDQQYGLLMVAPVYALWLAGAILLLRRREEHAPFILGVIATTLVVASCFPMWWGGWSPAGRFLVPLLPVLAFCSVTAWRALSRRPSVRRLVGVLLAVSLGVSFMSAVFPDKQYGVAGERGHSFWVAQVERVTGSNLSGVLPRLVDRDSAWPLVGALFWLLAWLGLTLWLVRASLRDSTTGTT